MKFHVLAMKSFDVGLYEADKAVIGDITGIKPSFEYNNNLNLLKSNMYSFEDYMIGEIGTFSEFKSYLLHLEKINSVLNDCPFLEMYRATNTYIGKSLTECLIWWEVNLDLIFRPSLLNEFFINELEQLRFHAMHLKMLELFRFCSGQGFLQLNANLPVM